MIVRPSASSYTLSHEVGHLLGLGEGYGDLAIRAIGAAPVVPGGGPDHGTLPGEEGTPMANPGEAGRDANRRQLAAIVGYAEAALAQGGSQGRYGATVRHYRARWAP